LKVGTAFGMYIMSLIYKPSMKFVKMLFKNKFLLFFVISIGSVIGMVRGEEAKQKWVFKIRSKVDTKKLIAEKRQQAKKGGVLLDDIEMASFHKS
jgi:hypothetical protein